MPAPEKLAVRLHTLAYGGEAVGRTAEGLTVFVPLGAPGDEAEILITDRHRRFLRGRIAHLTTSSPERVSPPCPYFGDCGGCHLQHLAYAAQLAHKKRAVEDALARIGGLGGVPVRDVLGMADPWAYRTRATYVFAGKARSMAEERACQAGEFRGGFFASRSHRVVDIAACLIQHPLNNRILAAVKELAAEGFLPVFEPRTGRGLLRWMETRVDRQGTHAVLTLVTTRRRWDKEGDFAARLRARVPQVTGILRRFARREPDPADEDPGAFRVVHGEPYLYEELAGLRWRVHAGSFFQVNPERAEELATQALQFAGLAGGETVIDAYSGVGLLAILAARRGATAMAIEDSPLAIADAECNAAALLGATLVESARRPARPIQLLRERVEVALPRLREQGIRPDIVILDPPRSGAMEAVPAVAALGPRRIVYVSCDPATLARDLGMLASRGYGVKEVQPIDMFPHTYHIECVARLDA